MVLTPFATLEVTEEITGVTDFVTEVQELLFASPFTLLEDDEQEVKPELTATTGAGVTVPSIVEETPVDLKGELRLLLFVSRLIALTRNLYLPFPNPGTI